MSENDRIRLATYQLREWVERHMLMRLMRDNVRSGKVFR
jgi:hypothetical protein